MLYHFYPTFVLFVSVCGRACMYIYVCVCACVCVDVCIQMVLIINDMYSIQIFQETIGLAHYEN